MINMRRFYGLAALFALAGCQQPWQSIFLNVTPVPAEATELRVEVTWKDGGASKRTEGIFRDKESVWSRIGADQVRLEFQLPQWDERAYQFVVERMDRCQGLRGTAGPVSLSWERTQDVAIQLAAVAPASDCVPPPKEACPAGQFCWANPLPSGASIKRIWADGPNRMWAVGDNELVLRYDGTRWVDVPPVTMNGSPRVHLHGLWGASADEIWVAGFHEAGSGRGIIARYRAGSWSILREGGRPEAICGNQDGVFVGQDNLNLEHFSKEGQRLGTIPLPSSTTEGWINDVSCGPNGDVWAGGWVRPGGVKPDTWGLWHRKGGPAVAVTLPAPSANDPSGVLAILSAPDGSLVVGAYDMGPILLRKTAGASSFERSPYPSSGPSGGNASLWPAAPGSIWASNGYLYRYRFDLGPGPMAWTQEPVPEPQWGELGIQAIGGTSTDDLWVGGEGGQIFHRTSSGWQRMRPTLESAFLHFEGIAAAQDGGLYLAAGRQGIFHYDRMATFRRISADPAAKLAAEQSGHVLGLWADGVRRYDQMGRGSLIMAGAFPNRSSLWTDGSGDVWAWTSGQDRVSHNRAPMSEVIGAGFRLYELWGVSAEDIWAVGEDGGGGAIYRRQQGTWRLVAHGQGKLGAGRGIWGDGTGGVWVKLVDSKLLRWKDGAWSIIETPGHCEWGIWGGGGPDEVWVPCWGQLLRFAKDGWRQYAYPNDPRWTTSLRDSFTDGKGTTWFAGDYGTLVYFRSPP